MEQGIRMILVPAGMTGLLQPLDTHVFNPFRDRMQQLWIECKSNASDGQVNLRARKPTINGVPVRVGFRSNIGKHCSTLIWI